MHRFAPAARELCKSQIQNPKSSIRNQSPPVWAKVGGGLQFFHPPAKKITPRNPAPHAGSQTFCKKNPKNLQIKLDVTNPFVYHLSTPLIRGSPKRQRRPDGHNRHQAGRGSFPGHGLSVAPMARREARRRLSNVYRKRPCREGVPERTKGGREKVVTRAVASAAMLPFVGAEQGLHGTVRKFERKF